MPDWSEIEKEIIDEIAKEKPLKEIFDRIRYKYLKALHENTGRNIIVYYSSWLTRPSLNEKGIAGINDNDMNGFMTTVHGLDRSKGLDLILHTPGGNLAATESIVEYLRSMFDDIRAVVPQIAMSTGTMIACACRQILMGKHSSLGPIDPEIDGVRAAFAVEEFRRAYKEIQEDPARAQIWNPILSQYNPTRITECEKAIEWVDKTLKNWLLTRMLQGKKDAKEKAETIRQELIDPGVTKSHSRHISIAKCEEIGLEVERLEDDQELQDAVLSVHHAYMHFLTTANSAKIIENHQCKKWQVFLSPDGPR